MTPFCMCLDLQALYSLLENPEQLAAERSDISVFVRYVMVDICAFLASEGGQFW